MGQKVVRRASFVVFEIDLGRGEAPDFYFLGQ